MDPRELHADRLGTTDATGARVYLYPVIVRGWFRKRREALHLVFLAIFLLVPFLRYHGRQAILLDIGSRRFDFFSLSLRAHNAPLLFFILIAAVFALLFVTSIWGRIWCGWACPQTVFIEAVFRRIETWVEGAPGQRKALAQGPWTTKKLQLRALKWTLYVAASLVITHSFLSYFVGVDRLQAMILQDPRGNWTSFLFIVFATGIILFDFAWFREQFCIIACPYGRFQSVLMDSHSLVVAYDAKRGEPRKGSEVAQGRKTGDCVNCFRCVQVCPTGIDIRRGTQMECIACTACIDACDEIMTKLNKPIGLIRYDSVRGLAQDPQRPRRKWRARSIVYLSITALSLLTLILLIWRLNPLDIAILRAKDLPYSINDGLVINHFRFEISNQSEADYQLETRLVATDSAAQLILAQQPLEIRAGTQARPDFFIRFSPALLKNGSAHLEIEVEGLNRSTNEKSNIRKQVTLVGPFTP